VTRRGRLTISLGVALGLAVVWWIIALAFEARTGVPVWADQRTTFTQAVHHLADPYPALAWPYVPWAVVPLIPFGLLPLRWAVLLQMGLYFSVLALIVHRFGGGLGTLLLVLTSALAFDTALEINLEWIVCIGLLVPRAWSGPLLLVKPQVALGYWLGFRWREWLWGGVIVLVVAGLALLVWGDWPVRMWADIQQNTLGSWGAFINIAPSVLAPRIVAWGIGLLLAWRAWRCEDTALGVLAGLFFMPYVTIYSALPAFALFAVRAPRWALLISLSVWVVYAGYVIPFLLQG
jgi:hypothetical protein